MTTLYWGLEFAKVTLCYIFILFIWPSVIFRRYLQNKSKMFRFCFCATAQLVLINAFVLLLGLGYLLNPWVVNILFYGSFVYSARSFLLPDASARRDLRKLVTGTLSLRHLLSMCWMRIVDLFRKALRKLWRLVRPRLVEYILLSALVAYGVAYFSYSAFSSHSYGFSDMYTHHAWIYDLVQGKIFSDGIYPEGMHCVIYLMHTISGVSVYSCNLFLGGVNTAVFLLSLYWLMREIFRWRGTPLLVLTVYLVFAVKSVDLMASMARLQPTLPEEYGLHTVFLCALFLLRFLKEELQKDWREEPWAWLKNENLFLFIMSLAASIAIHFYITIIAFFVCLPFAVVFIRRIFSGARLRSLIAAVLCGVMLATFPMGGAWLTGIRFQGSINWALRVIRGEITEAQIPEEETPEGETPEDETPEGETPEEAETEPGASEGGIQTPDIQPGSSQESGQSEGSSALSTLLGRVKSVWSTVKAKAIAFYRFGYGYLLGGEVQGASVVCVSVLMAVLWLIYRLICRRESLRESAGIFDSYLPIIGASILLMLMYAAPYIGLPELVSYNRVPATAYILLLMVMAMPVDILFWALRKVGPNWAMKAAPAVCVVGIIAATVLTGQYHGYYYTALSRYRSVVDVTNSIVQSFPRYTYTIVSSTDEIYSVIEYGRHEELLDFLKHAERTESYYLPTEYVFVFVEKKPIQHGQYSFSSGPKWLAANTYSAQFAELIFASTYPEIFASQVSDEYGNWLISSYPTVYSSYQNLYIRTIINSKAYKWCKDFDELYDNEMKIYYEDEDFVCYYFQQNTYSLYNLAIWS